MGSGQRALQADLVRLRREMGFGTVLHGDCEELEPQLRGEGFEVILAGEILEHVSNAGRFLQSVASVMAEETELIITTPNASSIRQFLYGLLRREKVHEDHNYYFSYRTIRQLLGKFGLTCTETCFFFASCARFFCS